TLAARAQDLAAARSRLAGEEAVPARANEVARLESALHRLGPRKPVMRRLCANEKGHPLGAAGYGGAVSRVRPPSQDGWRCGCISARHPGPPGYHLRFARRRTRVVALVSTVAYLGLEARPIEVQGRIPPGRPTLHRVGLPD